MLKKTFALAALAGAALIAAAPALADGNRHGHHKRVVVAQQHAPHYAQRRWHGHRAPVVRRAVMHRPVAVRPAPVVVYRQRSSHDVLGGLILGAMIGAVIANHAGH